MRLLSYLFTLFFAFNALAVAPYGIKGQSQSGTLYSNVHQFPNQQVTNLGGINALVETGNKNILANPSFEHSTFSTGWVNSSGTFTEETAIEIDGLKAAKLVLSAQTMSLTQSSTLYASQFADGVQGLAMVRVKSDVALKVCAIQAGVVSTSLCVDVPAHNKWGLYKVPFILGATSNGISIASSGAVSGTAYIDDAFLGAVDLSATQSFDTTCDTIACETNFTSYVDASGNHSSENKDFISSVSVASTSTFTVNFNASVFTSSPACVITTADGSGGTTNGSVVTIISSSTTSMVYRTNRHDATAVAYPAFIHCDRTATDYTAAINAQKAFQKTKVSSFSSTNADTDWASCGHTTSDFTGFGTVTAIETQCKRQGGDLLMKGKFTVGTTTATEARLNLKLNSTSLTSKGVSAIPSIQIAGDAGTNTAATTYFRSAVMIEPSVTYVTFSSQSSTTSVQNKVNGSGLLSSGNLLTFNARIPINGWENSNIIIGQFNGLESCADSYECTDSFSANISTSNIVSKENIDWIEGNSSGTSTKTITFKSGVFTQAPNCVATVSDTSASGNIATAWIQSISSTQIIVNSGNAVGTVAANYPIQIICQKQGVDYIGKTAKSVASDQNLRTPSITNAVLHSCAFTNNATTIAIDSNYSALCNAWIQSVSRSTTGTAAIVVKTGAFSSLPVCTGATPAANFGRFVEILPNSVTSITAEVNAGNDSLVDKAFQITCHGIAP